MRIAALPVVLAATLLGGCISVQPRITLPDRLPELPRLPGFGRDTLAIGARPLPGPMPYSAAFRRAVENGTRTLDGRPGPRYWVNRATYDLDVRLDPAAKRVDGTARIRYTNRSPDALPRLVLELAQNYHKGGAPRVDAAEVTQGLELTSVKVGGVALREGAGYRVNGTSLMLTLAQPLASGASAEVEIAYGFTVPQAGISGRMGYTPAEGFGSGPSLVYLAYWYPQMAVYDDVRGWNVDDFLGTGEFYSDHADYTVSVEVPSGWLVQGTGTLQNAEAVLTAQTRARLARAAASDAPVRVAEATDAPTTPGTQRFRFAAQNVRDVAFSATQGYVWDAVRTDVGDRDGDGRADYALAQALWRTNAPRWAKTVRYNQHATAFHGRHTGVPYPWPHMTAVEAAGIIGGGMEYPMMTIIGSYTNRTDADLYAVTSHEIAHMWSPMIVSTDERRHGWQDEGHTMYLENQSEKDFAPVADLLAYDREDAPGYVAAALAGDEGEMMRRTDYQYPGLAGVVASYDKPVSVLVALREMIGEEAFQRGWQDYHRTWAYKHPTPFDFFHAMNLAAGRDLSWFWQAWYFTTWTLDQSVASVTYAGGRSTVTVRDLGQVPMPVWLTLTYEGGRTERRDVPVETWLRGRTEATVTVQGRVVKAEIDARRLAPDVDRANNVWPR